MKTRTTILIALFLSTLLLAGCNNNKKHSYNYSFEQRYVTITTEPSNAKVTLLQPFGQPSVYLGKTPLKARPVAVMTKLTSVKNMRISPQAYATYLNNAVVRIELEGYEYYYGPLKTDPNETLSHHIDLQPIPAKK